MHYPPSLRAGVALLLAGVWSLSQTGCVDPQPRSGSAPATAANAAPVAPATPEASPLKPASPALAAAAGMTQTPPSAEALREANDRLRGHEEGRERLRDAEEAEERGEEGEAESLDEQNIAYAIKHGTLTADQRTELLEEEQEAAEEAERDEARALAAKSGDLQAEPQDEPDRFERYQEEIRRQIGALVSSYGSNYRIEALEALDQEAPIASPLGKASGTIDWTERGPGNVQGRTRAIAVDPADPTGSTWLVGSVGGGVWKTTNAGLTWTDLTPTLPSIAVTTIAQSPSNPDIVYFGTGEGFGNSDAISGDGIWKSINRGISWTQLLITGRIGSDGSTATSFGAINRLLVSPSDPKLVLAATNTGLYRSTNGGTKWTKVYTGPSGQRVQQVVAEPGNFTVQYATVNGVGVLKSEDSGVTWTQVFETSGARYELAIAPSNPAILYLGAETSSTVSDLYVSQNRGATWGIVTQASSPNWLNGQGWYDNALTVNPVNASVAYVGGLDIYRINSNLATATGTQFTPLTVVNLPAWLTGVNYSGAKNGLTTGATFFGAGVADATITNADYVNVELRFGAMAGCTNNPCSQKAHRFNSGATAGFQNYVYKDYVDVPFEVWDTQNNRQLMASFRDTPNPGNGFDLANLGDGQYLLNGQREYIFAQAIPYSPTPALNVAVTGGLRIKTLYAAWAIVSDGYAWPNVLSTPSKVEIKNSTFPTYARTSTRLTVWSNGTTATNYVHADHHFMGFVPVPTGWRMMSGSDGGVAYSDNVVNDVSGTTATATWTKTAGGYNTTQMYGADKRPGAAQYIGGLQDNGTWSSQPGQTAGSMSTFRNGIGGDGFGVAWHAEDPNKVLGSLYYARVYRSTDGGASFAQSTSGITEAGTNTTAPFITTIGKTNSDPDLVFTTVAGNVYRSDDFGASWIKATLTSPTSWYTYTSRVPVNVSPVDPRIVWAGAASSGALRIQRSTDGGLTFSPTADMLYNGTTIGSVITGLWPGTINRDVAFATAAVASKGKIFRTTDGGTSWTNITGQFSTTSALSENGFPNVATFSVLQMPFDANTIWAGTEIGLVVSTDGGASWRRPAFNFPNVAVYEMKIVDDQVVVATHGRGIWSATLSDLQSYVLPVVTRTPRIDLLAQKPSGNITLQISRRSAYDSLVVYRNGVRNRVLSANTATTTNEELTYSVTSTSALTFQLYAYRSGELYKSSIKSITPATATAPVAGYTTSLNVAADASAFTLSGFSIPSTNPSGFTNGALHTPHPYTINTGRSVTLKAPIVVSAGSPTISFDEIAVLEPCNDDPVYCASNFYDYAVMEATKDGQTWVKLAGPYDSRAKPAWLAAFTTNVAPTAVGLCQPFGQIHRPAQCDRVS